MVLIWKLFKKDDDLVFLVIWISGPTLRNGGGVESMFTQNGSCILNKMGTSDQTGPAASKEQGWENSSTRYSLLPAGSAKMPALSVGRPVGERKNKLIVFLKFAIFYPESTALF